MSTPGSKQGRKYYKFDDLRYWAENGMICLHDERDESRSHIDPLTWLERAEAVGMEAESCIYPSERDKFTNTANEMEACSAEAIAMGNPLDPMVQAYWVKHKSLRRPFAIVGAPQQSATKSIILPGSDKAPRKGIIVP